VSLKKLLLRHVSRAEFSPNPLMRYHALVLSYVVVTTLAMILFKQGAARSTFSLTGGLFSGQIDGRAVAGVVLYVLSFALWLLVLSARPVTYIVPLTTGLVHVSILGAAFFFLKEGVSSMQLVGAGLVVAGAALIAMKGP
jgi:drug/metabolite transporter (DMT)-like permease